MIGKTPTRKVTTDKSYQVLYLNDLIPKMSVVVLVIFFFWQ